MLLVLGNRYDFTLFPKYCILQPAISDLIAG